MRLHILIYACSAAVPVLGLSLDPKIDAFMEALNYSGLIPVPSLTEEQLASAMEKLTRDRDVHAAELEAEAAEFRTLAQGDIGEVYTLL